MNKIIPRHKSMNIDISTLGTLTQSELIEVHESTCPKNTRPPSKQLLKHEIAFALQSELYGGINAQTQHLIKQLYKIPLLGQSNRLNHSADSMEIVNSVKTSDSNHSVVLKPASRELLSEGSRLIRRWRGNEYEVVVADGHYHFQGNSYKSLTRIAKEITGAHWSGPRFFGLTARINNTYK